MDVEVILRQFAQLYAVVKRCGEAAQRGNRFTRGAGIVNDMTILDGCRMRMCCKSSTSTRSARRPGAIIPRS